MANNSSKHMAVEIKAADLPIGEITGFLSLVDNEFSRPLSSRVGDLTEYAKKLSDNSELVWAFYEKRPVGLIATYINDMVTREAFIAQVVVLKNFRGLHIGTQLIETAMRMAKKRGMKTVKLEVAPTASAARQLYSRLGFSEVGESAGDLIMLTKHI